ncbi:MAG: C2H2-type zinc finger protein [Nitrososphaeria archaeon]
MSETSQAQKVETETIQAKPVQKVYKCKKCGKEFTSIGAYRAHVWEHVKAERAASKERKKVETEEIMLTKEGKPVRKVGAWDRLKWFVIGGMALLALYVLFLWWRKKSRKEGEEGEEK